MKGVVLFNPYVLVQRTQSLRGNAHPLLTAMLIH